MPWSYDEDLVISIHALPRRATTMLYGAINRFDISIHALPRRATIELEYENSTQEISIHALPRRATDQP